MLMEAAFAEDPSAIGAVALGLAESWAGRRDEARRYASIATRLDRRCVLLPRLESELRKALT